MAEGSTGRLIDLQRMADARRGQPGYAQNVADIEAEIAKLQQPTTVDERSHSSEVSGG